MESLWMTLFNDGMLQEKELVVWCEREEDAVDLFRHLDSLGYTWASGESLLRDRNEHNGNADRAYWIDGGRITYGTRAYAEESRESYTVFARHVAGADMSMFNAPDVEDLL